MLIDNTGFQGKGPRPTRPDSPLLESLRGSRKRSLRIMDEIEGQDRVGEDGALILSTDRPVAPTIPIPESPLPLVWNAKSVVLAALHQQCNLLREVLTVCDDPPLPT
jgi:hypothetical protein